MIAEVSLLRQRETFRRAGQVDIVLTAKTWVIEMTMQGR